MIVFAKAHPATRTMRGGDPTPEQAASGEYPKERMPWHGLTIAIEHPEGTVREGVDETGKPWRTVFRYAYGEILGTLGLDGDPVDVFIGSYPDAPEVYLVQQMKRKQWDTPDEQKCMINFASIDEAKAAYLGHYDDPRFFGGITAMPVAEFITKVRATRDKPAMIKAVLFLKAKTRGDHHTIDMFGTHVEHRVRRDGVVQAYHVSAPKPASVPSPAPAPEQLEMPTIIPADVDVFAEALRQANGEDERVKATFTPKIKPVSLPRLSTKNPIPKDMNFLSPEEAAQRVETWKAEAERQGREKASANAMRTVISLFDASGVISQPWVDAGYNVVTYDLQHGDDINAFNAEVLLESHGNDEVWAILAQPPCTDYANSGAQWWKDKDADGRTEASNELVRQTLRTIELFRPPVWVMENPTGRIASQNNLPDPLLRFDPWHFGDNYTKRTELYGNFNPNLPLAPTEPTAGSKIHKLSSSAKYERSLTPEGFAYALFMANNAESFSVPDRLAREFPGVDAGLFRAALDAGHDEHGVRAAIEDAYYDSDLEFVREELAHLAGAKPLGKAMTNTHAPMVLFFKGHVGPYLRGGKLVNLAGYQGRQARAVASAGQLGLFGGEPQHTEPTRDLIAEHERLVGVLRSPSHEDDKAEAERQAKELDEYKHEAASAQTRIIFVQEPSRAS